MAINKTVTFYNGVRVIKDAQVRTVGDKELVTVTVAVNALGAKAKERYVTKFVDATFSGFDAPAAKSLKKGDTIAFHGTEGNREYTNKKTGDKALSFEVPYASDLVIARPYVKAEETDDSDGGNVPQTEPPVTSSAPTDDPFA